MSLILGLALVVVALPDPAYHDPLMRILLKRAAAEDARFSVYRLEAGKPVTLTAHPDGRITWSIVATGPPPPPIIYPACPPGR